MNDTAPACVKCQRPLWATELADGRWACLKCEQHAAAQLRALPDLFRHISRLAALLKGASGGTIAGPSRSLPAPLRLDVLALIATGGAVTILQAVEDDWRKTRGAQMGATRRHDDIAGVTEYLTMNLRWACERYEEVGEDLVTIRRLHSRLTAVDTGEPPPRPIGVACPCGTVLTVTLKTEHKHCAGCGARYGHTEVLSLPLAERSAA